MIFHPLKRILCSVGISEWPSSQMGGEDKVEDMPTLSPLPGPTPVEPSPDVTVSLAESPRVRSDISPGLPPQSTPIASAATTQQTKPLASVLPSIINMLNSPVKHSLALPAITSLTTGHGSPKSIVSSLSSGMVLTPAGVCPVPSSTPATAHHIPCLTEDGSGSCEPPMLIRQGAITPDLWGVHDVCRFLCVNDCEAHCDSFRKKVGHCLSVREHIVNKTSPM